MERLSRLLNAYPKLKRILIDYSAQIKKITVIAFLIIAVFAVFLFSNSKDNGPIPEEKIENTSNEITANIYVDIGGEVVCPMLAELPEGSRVEDAIKAAGGLTEFADLSSINRAEFLEDGEKIYIPAKIDAAGSLNGSIAESNVSTSSASVIESGGKVNINTADSESLQTLNGIGPVTAQKIIDYRKTSGRFKTTDDLKNVSGIGDKTFEKLKDYICI